MITIPILILAALAVWIAACILDLFIQGVREIRFERRCKRQHELNAAHRYYYGEDLPY